jgi:hypothetical protein
MKYAKHLCQHCGSDSKWVETLIDDEFTYNEHTKEYEANGFSDDFRHTGVEVCTKCNKPRTGQ